MKAYNVYMYVCMHYNIYNSTGIHTLCKLFHGLYFIIFSVSI